MGRYANSARAGLLDELRGLRDRHPPIGDVRGIGPMIGVEIVRDRDTHAPAGAERERIVRGAFEKGLLTLPCGKSTIRLSPPLVCTTPTPTRRWLKGEEWKAQRRYVDEVLRLAQEKLSGTQTDGTPEQTIRVTMGSRAEAPSHLLATCP